MKNKAVLVYIKEKLFLSAFMVSNAACSHTSFDCRKCQIQERCSNCSDLFFFRTSIPYDEKELVSASKKITS